MWFVHGENGLYVVEFILLNEKIIPEDARRYIGIIGRNRGKEFTCEA
jgi:hypothetical protein